MSMHIRRVGSVVLATTVLVAMLPAAHVAAWNDYCNSTTRRICLWEHASYSGLIATKDAQVANYVVEGDFPGSSTPVNDHVSSVANRFANEDVRFYYDGGWYGYLRCVPQGTWVNYVTDGQNDRYSSHDKGDYC